jgi:hypothetical protein
LQQQLQGTPEIGTVVELSALFLRRISGGQRRRNNPANSKRAIMIS